MAYVTLLLLQLNKPSTINMLTLHSPSSPCCSVCIICVHNALIVVFSSREALSLDVTSWSTSSFLAATPA